MAQTPVLGSGPIDISFGGKQYSFPLSAFYFDDKSAIQIDSSFLPVPSVPNLQTALSLWLNYLVNQAMLSPGQTPMPQPALLIQARDPGSTGNFISVKLANVTAAKPVQNSTVDVTVTETDTYVGLTLDTIDKVIGKASGGGSRPGLVFLASTIDPNNTKLPTGSLPISATPKAPANPGDSYEFTFGTGPSAFTLQAKHPDTEGQFTTVTITKIEADGKTFTLVAEWKKPQQTGVKLSDLADSTKTPFLYELVITPPSGGFTSAPAAGTITLAGGIDAQPAASAQATVPSAS